MWTGGDSKYWCLSKSSAPLIYCFPTAPRPLFLINFFSFFEKKISTKSEKSTDVYKKIITKTITIMIVRFTFINIGGDDDDEDEDDEKID